MPSLCEKYRPNTMDDILGQPKALRRLRAVLDRPTFDGDAFWVVGPSGSGKTSLARIIAKRFASPMYTYELDGECCTIAAVREARSAMEYGTLDGGFKVWIVNESQAMTAKAVQAWLTVLDPVPPNVIVIFTTTADSEDLFGEYDSPFRSRCKTVAFTNQGLCDAFAARAKEIAVAECLDGLPLPAYRRLVQRCKNNFRDVLQRIDNGEMADDR